MDYEKSQIAFCKMQRRNLKRNKKSIEILLVVGHSRYCKQIKNERVLAVVIHRFFSDESVSAPHFLENGGHPVFHSSFSWNVGAEVHGLIT